MCKAGGRGHRSALPGEGVKPQPPPSIGLFSTGQPQQGAGGCHIHIRGVGHLDKEVGCPSQNPWQPMDAENPAGVMTAKCQLQVGLWTKGEKAEDYGMWASGFFLLIGTVRTHVLPKQNYAVIIQHATVSILLFYVDIFKSDSSRICKLCC